MRWLFRTDRRSFYCLNATQFLGALNDNVFKLLVIYLLINVKGPASANAILSLAGAIFVIPFLLFSSGAGVVADRISKRTVIVFTKILEVLIMLFGVMAVSLKWDIGAYVALFFMATQSAIFGPSKYGVIPELVDSKMVSKANGSMTSFTYLAIILGTFLASFLTDVTNKNFVVEACVCVFIAVVGLLTSLGIRKTDPQNSPKKINPLFLYEIYQTLKTSWHIPHLLPAIFGSAFFLFIGAFTQLNIIPFAMQSLHLSEVGGGYLFLATAVGIAIGAVIAGQLSKDRVEPGISCICGFFIAVLFFLLYFFASSLTVTIICLAFLGIFGGAFLIPFDAFIQVNSPDEKRGQVIAASNFFSFVGVLFASFFLYFFSEKLGFSAASGFAVMGTLTLLSTILIIGRLSGLFFPFFVRKVLKRFRRLNLVSPLPGSNEVIIFQSNSWWDVILLFSCIPSLKILVPGHFCRNFPFVNGWFDTVRIVPRLPESNISFDSLFGQTVRIPPSSYTTCLFLHRGKNNEQIIAAYKKIFARCNYKVVYAHGEKEILRKRFFSPLSQKQITLSFRDY